MFTVRQLCLVLIGSIQTLVVLATATTDGSDNALEYGIFCNIYRLLQHSPSGPYFSSNEQEVGRVVDNINYLLNSSTVENFQNDSIGEDLKTWVKKFNLREARKEGAIVAKFDLLLGKAIRLKNDIEREKASAGSKMVAARLSLAKAVYGDNAKVEDGGPAKPGKLTLESPGVFQHTSDTAQACGMNSGGSASAAAGISLVNDFFCLCVGKADSKKACSNDLVGRASIASYQFQLNSLNDVDASWGKIVQHCPDKSEGPDEANLLSALRVFHSTLGRQAKAGNDGKGIGPYVFGEADTLNTGCTGADGQFCINYALNLQPGGPGIPWERHIRQGVKELAEVRRAERKANDTFKELQKLEDQAKHLYIDAAYPTMEAKLNESSVELVKGHPTQRQAPIGTATEQTNYANQQKYACGLSVAGTLFLIA